MTTYNLYVIVCVMSNENTIEKSINKFNVFLGNLEAALTVIEYSVSNYQPIPTLAKLTVEESCEDIQHEAENLMRMINNE